jgi:3-hydroxyisobutyrate dehydrogenase-like beta-hydroxyacid dehydrogenase
MPAQHTPARSVTVLGLGPMGRAMVTAFRNSGIAVTVWNRSPDKAEAMSEFGATPATTVPAALDANDVVVLSLTDYAAMYEVFGQAPTHLSGKVIVNLSSDSPGRARAGAAWVRAHGAEFLSGGVMSAGDNLDHPASYLFYSGPREVFDAHAGLLRPLGPQEYLGVDDGLAQVFYQGLLTVFHPWLLAFDQATAMIAQSGHDIAQFLPYALRSNAAFPYFMEGITARNRAGGHAEPAGLRMMRAGARHIVETSEEAGVDAALSRTAEAFWHNAIDASARLGRPVSTYELMRTSHKGGD